MSQTIEITIAAAGTDTGPFNLFSDADAYVTAFATGIAKSALLAGYTSTVVPDAATIIRVKSNNANCTNYVDMTITGQPSGECTYNGGYTEIYSLLTNNGQKTVVAVMRKNNGSNITATTVAYNSTGRAFLGSTEWTDSDSLEIILTDTVGGQPTYIGNPFLFPNGSAALEPTSILNSGTASVTLVFNGDGSGWGAGGNMFWFNLTFSANT